MAVRIEWQTSVRTSQLWSVRAFLLTRSTASRSLADPRLAPALEPLAAELSALFPLDGFPTRALSWPALLALSLDDPSPAELAQRLDAREISSLPVASDTRPDSSASSNAPPRTHHRAACIEAIDAALRQIWPRLESELPLRIGPLREQWEARGPGLVARMARRAAWGPWDWNQTVALLHPAWGGAGERAADSAQTILLEALLTNTDPQLPEVLRLAWLLAQRALLAQRFPELERQSPTLAAIATLPLVLEAGHYVELVPPHPELLARACAAWLPELAPSQLAELSLDTLPEDYPEWLAGFLRRVA